MKSFRRTLCLATAGAALGLFSATPALAQQSLTVVSWGGAYTHSQVMAYHKPWEKKTGIHINSVDYNVVFAHFSPAAVCASFTPDAACPSPPW